jgi:fructokinase
MEVLNVRIVSVGEILWDVIGENEYLGGAPLNFGAHAQKLGHEVMLLSAVGDDARGRRALELLRNRAMSTDLVQVLSGQNTGTAEVDLDSEGKPTFRVVRPAAYDFVDLQESELGTIAKWQPHWIYFGTLHHMSEQSLASTLKLLAAVPTAKRFYDVNLREGHWHLGAVEQLSRHATVVKLSDAEAESLDVPMQIEGLGTSVEGFCRRWIAQYGCEIMCVTFGERGSAILKDGRYTEVTGYRVQVADTVGAGDAFSGAFLHGLDQGWDAHHIGTFANAVGALVASRPGALPEWNVAEVMAMVNAAPAQQQQKVAR